MKTKLLRRLRRKHWVEQKGDYYVICQRIDAFKVFRHVIFGKDNCMELYREWLLRDAKYLIRSKIKKGKRITNK
tara:strand:+ start:19380 stop:19601 length:222 start_codon:yes stop_codon:yes gene_type:complete